jgi:PEP-CTERM motif
MPRLQSSLLWTLTLSLVCVVISSQSANATPFSLATGVGANLGCVPATCQPDNSGDHDADFSIAGPDNGAGYVSVSDLTDTFGDTAFTYFAQANASFGKLQAGASGTYNLSSPGTRDAYAFAGVVDQLTLSALGVTGTGTLDLSFLLEGELAGTGGGGGAMFAGVAWGQNPELLGSGNQFQLFQYATSGPHAGALPSAPVVVSPITFEWGQPFYLQMFLAVGAGTPLSSLLDCNGGDACLTPTTGAGSGTADFYNTMLLSGLVPTDANGDPVLNAEFSSGSGATYSLDGIVAQPVPEPGSLVLLGTGSMVLAYKRRRDASGWMN